MSDVKRRLTITGCRSVYQGTNRKGDPYTIYEIGATDEAGQIIQQTLKSFDELAIGLSAEFEIDPYDGGQHGWSYTLKQIRPKLGPRVQYLEEIIYPNLLARIEQVERQLGISSQPPRPPIPEGSPVEPPPAQGPPPLSAAPPSQQPPAQQQPPPLSPPPVQSTETPVVPAPENESLSAKFGGDDDIPF
jgi:hypothetical protein